MYFASYGTFVSRNCSWLLGILAYISLLLAALQVGLAAVSATNERDDRRFSLAAYQTSIILILAPMGLCVTTMLLYVTLFFFRLMSALRFYKVRGDSWKTESAHYIESMNSLSLTSIVIPIFLVHDCSP